MKAMGLLGEDVGMGVESVVLIRLHFAVAGLCDDFLEARDLLGEGRVYVWVVAGECRHISALVRARFPAPLGAGGRALVRGGTEGVSKGVERLREAECEVGD